MDIRKAELRDLEEVVQLLHDDLLGSARESVKDMTHYKIVFLEILNSDYFDIYVMEIDHSIIGCYQIMFLPHISFNGTKRVQVESVRIKSEMRNKGLGHKLMKHAIEIGKKQGCGIFQLTSNKQRVEANKFYRNLGLEPSHDGYKLYFDKTDSQ